MFRGFCYLVGVGEMEREFNKSELFRLYFILCLLFLKLRFLKWEDLIIMIYLREKFVEIRI